LTWDAQRAKLTIQEAVAAPDTTAYSRSWSQAVSQWAPETWDAQAARKTPQLPFKVFWARNSNTLLGSGDPP
jgi:hypothetical protein